MTEATTAYEYLKAKYDIETWVHIHNEREKEGATAIIEDDFMGDRAEVFFDEHKEEILKAIDDDKRVQECSEDGEILDKFGLLMAFIRGMTRDVIGDFNEEQKKHPPEVIPPAKYLMSKYDLKTWRHVHDVRQSSCIEADFSTDEIIAFVDKHREDIEGCFDEWTKNHLKECVQKSADDPKKEISDDDPELKDWIFHQYVMQLADDICYDEDHDDRGNPIEVEDEDVSEDYEARVYDSEVRDLLIKKARKRPLVGEDLLRLVYELGDVSKSDMVLASGYVSKSWKHCWRERLNYTAFYAALLKAKGVEMREESAPFFPVKEDSSEQYPYIQGLKQILGAIVVLLAICIFIPWGFYNLFPAMPSEVQNLLEPIVSFLQRNRFVGRLIQSLLYFGICFRFKDLFNE